ncbi:hypothetical protein BaRGS_00015733 [Batillaria attramentaria]|uniref:Uncharacterized protein n=1 Tax=Batillaria attramentaria TaxID=370345 RepID=A0ABD0L136_9CAEN
MWRLCVIFSMRMTVVIYLAHLLNTRSCACDSKHVHRKLRYYETLNTVDVSSRAKRSVDGSYLVQKEISFRAFGRTFDLILSPGSPVLAPDLKAKTVDRHGRETLFHVSPHDFYTGHLAEGRSVKVHAHFEDGILSASVHFPSEVYVVEPAWRHLPPSDNYTMIVYRASDVKRDEATPIEGTSGEFRFFPDFRTFNCTNRTSRGTGCDLYRQNREMKWAHWKMRHKRAVCDKKMCRLLVVVDYDFYRNVGITEQNTIQYLVDILHKTNERYKTTVWDVGMSGFGLQIADITIHTGYTERTGHYNQKKQWGSRDKLIAFFRTAKSLTKYCLGHLFTSYAFADRTLGLAAKADSDRSDPQGICGRPTFDPETQTMIGVSGGFSSAKDVYGYRLLKLELELVSSHEIGHSWGSSHDPDTAKCAPSSWNGGRYLMWPTALSGMAANNKLFSPCSKREIASVLKSKANLCFVRDTTDLCGNAVIDKDEECDVGLGIRVRENPCCTADCRLRRGAVCSDVNFACCVDCKVAANDTECASEQNLVCRKAAYCDGKSLNCPESEAADDNTPCLDRGECHNGECLSFCAVLGRKKGDNLAPCVCDQNSTASCRYCCLRNVSHSDGTYNSTCEPTEVILSYGRPCDLGFCVQGICKKIEATLIFRFFEHFSSFRFDRVAYFLKSNAVLLVVVLSLLVWIPASCVISMLDRHDEEQRTLDLAAANRAVFDREPPRRDDNHDDPTYFITPELVGSAGVVSKPAALHKVSHFLLAGSFSRTKIESISPQKAHFLR